MPPPSRRLPARRLIPSLFVLLPSLVVPKVAATDEPDRAIVERFREIIVLLDSEATLDPRSRSRARMIGRVLFHDNLRASQALSATLGSAIEGAVQASTLAEPAPVAEFLMRLEAAPDYHDADKLALREVLDDLAATIAQAPVGPLQSRLVARLALGDVEHRFRVLGGSRSRIHSRARAARHRAVPRHPHPHA